MATFIYTRVTFSALLYLNQSNQALVGTRYITPDEFLHEGQPDGTTKKIRQGAEAFVEDTTLDAPRSSVEPPGQIPFSYSSSGVVSNHIAGENIPAGRVVSLINGRVYLFNPSNTSNSSRAIGVSKVLACNGKNCIVIRMGQHISATNPFTTNSIYYATAYGVLSTIPDPNITLEVAIARNDHTLEVALNFTPAPLATNLGISNRTATTLDITSSTGTSATVPEASITEAGLLNASDKIQLNNLATDLSSKLVKASNLSDLTNVSDARTNLGLVIGTDVQAYDPSLSSIAGVSWVQGDVPYFSGVDTAAALAKDTGTSRFIKNSGASNNPAWAQPATTDLSDVTTWTDYSATSTISGWSSFTTKILRYHVMGKTVIYFWYISGTSNSVSKSYTIAQIGVSFGGGQNEAAGFSVNNGTTSASVGYLNLPANSSTANVYATGAGSNWTGSGTATSTGVVTLGIQ